MLTSDLHVVKDDEQVFDRRVKSVVHFAPRSHIGRSRSSLVCRQGGDLECVD